MSKLTPAGMTYRAKASDSSETDESRSKKTAFDQDLIDYITKAAKTGEKVGKGTKLATSAAIQAHLEESEPIPDPNVAFKDKKMAGIRSHFHRHATRRYIDPYAKANPVEHKVEELVDLGRIRGGGTISKPVDAELTGFGRITYGGAVSKSADAELADAKKEMHKEMYGNVVDDVVNEMLTPNGSNNVIIGTDAGVVEKETKVEPEEGLGFSGNILMGGRVVGVEPEEEEDD